jgi:hypothetical protein
MAGPRTVDVAFWESFGKGWYSDTKSHLKLKCNAFKADYGMNLRLPSLACCQEAPSPMVTHASLNQCVLVGGSAAPRHPCDAREHSA